MAGSIKGLTLELEGNTTKLVKALEEPAKHTKTLTSELKDVNKALKFDTKNVELLDQKQRLLTKAIGSTEDELKILKEAQQQYIASGKDIDGEEYVALEAKIAVVERSLERLQEQQNNFNGSVQALGAKAGEFGQKAQSVGKALMPVTAAVTAVGTASVAAFKEMDVGYDTVVTKTGATGEALDGLKDSVDKVFGSLPTSAEEAGIAIGEVNTRFGLTGEKLEGLSTEFVKFAKINETDLNNSIGMVNKNLQVFGLSADDAGGYMGILTERAQATGISVDDLMNSVQSNGPVFKEMGLSIEESVNLLAEFEKNGVNADTALAGLKKAQQNATKEGKTLSQSLGDTITKIKGASSETEALQIATELFGRKGAAEMTQAIREGRFSVEDLSASLGDFGNVVGDTFEGTQDAGDKLKTVMNNVTIAGKEIGEAIMDVVAPMIEKLLNSVRKCVEWFKNLSDGQKKLIVILGGVAAALGPTIYGVGKLSSGFSSMVEYFGKTTTIGGKFLASMKQVWNASSIGVGGLTAIVAVIAVVVAAFVSLWNNNEEFRKKMTEIWENIVKKIQELCQGIVDRLNALGFEFSDITEVIKAVWEGFCNFLAPIFETVWKQIENIITYYLDAVMAVIDIFIALFQGDWDGFWTGVQALWDATWTYILETVQNIIDGIMNLVSEFLSWFGVEWTPNFEEVHQQWKEIWGSIGNFIDEVIQTIKELVSAFISLFQGDWDGFCNHISNAWQMLWAGIQQFGLDIWNSIKGYCFNIWNGIKTLFIQILQGIKSKFEEIWNNIKGFLGRIWDGLKSKCQDVWNTIKDNIITPIQEAYDKVKEIFTNIKDWIEEKINGAKDVVKRGIDAIKNLFNFKIKWPHIPTPHFRVSGSPNPLDWLRGGAPSIRIDWKAKAMEYGQILDKPTIFGMMNGQLLGAGEAGPEAIVGVKSLKQLIDSAMDKAAARQIERFKQTGTAQSGSVEIDYVKLAAVVAEAVKGIAFQSVVKLDSREMAKAIAKPLDKELAILGGSR